MKLSQSQPEIRQLLQYNPYSQAVFTKLATCHTAQSGYHLMKCDNSACNDTYYQYHNCGNRHCMNCGGLKRHQWVDDRMSELLPTKYYHVVFTVPHELHSLFLLNRTKLFDLIFKAGHYTLIKLGRDPRWLGATPGIISILHTNGQDLSFHPHIHCIVSGGGIDKNGTWIAENRKNGKFLYPRRVMELMYKARFLRLLTRMPGNGEVVIPDTFDASVIESVAYKKWNVFAKAPFGGPAQIIEYLGRYTHKAAITSHRIMNITDTHVTFRYKDYKDGSKQKLMTLTHHEFVRRFEQHILPKRFVKIRHAGFMSHQGKKQRLERIYAQLMLPPPMPKVRLPAKVRLMLKTGQDISSCKTCKSGHYQVVDTLILWNGHYLSVHDVRSRGHPSFVKKNS